MRRTALAVAALAFLAAISVALAAEPSSKNVVTQAHALIQKHDNKGAIALLDALLKKEPKNAEALVTRGDAKDNLGQHLDALVDYAAAIDANPQYAYAYYTKCDTEIELDRNDQAVADCTKSIELDPTFVKSFVDRAYAYGNTQRYSESIADANAALKLDPASASALNARCRAERLLNDFEAARPDCIKAIALSPQYQQPVWGLGMIEYHFEHYDASAAQFEKALELDDTDESAHYWAALSYLELQQYDKALAHINGYIVKQRMDGDGFYSRAKIEAATGNKAAARTDLNEALRLYKIANDQDGIDSATALLASVKG